MWMYFENRVAFTLFALFVFSPATSFAQDHDPRAAREDHPAGRLGDDEQPVGDVGRDAGEVGGPLDGVQQAQRILPVPQAGRVVTRSCRSLQGALMTALRDETAVLTGEQNALLYDEIKKS